MAGEHRIFERRDVKMGKYKFPGKPNKTLNKRRVNLRSCELPKHNDLSAAGENIYIGLSVFKGTFGDNHHKNASAFPGFSRAEVEESMAEARLQQKQAQMECKRKGVNADLWSDFHLELSSMFTKTPLQNCQPVTETTVCFDGGGNKVNQSSMMKELSVALCRDFLNINKTVDKNKRSPTCQASTPIPAKRAKRKLVLQSPVSKSLQSQAAKKLLEKAKKVTVSDGANKKSVEKKFVLPDRSVRSSRVIKPNKKFIEDDAKKVETSEKPPKIEEPTKPACRVILREARLQLERTPLSLAEGPFSSPTPKRRANLVTCGVCGAVRFYRFIKQATKFGIQSCESCRKFISKVIKSRTTLGKDSVRCNQGTGLCMIPPDVRNTDWSPLGLTNTSRCQACWLKLCLKHFIIPEKMKSKLLALLPPDLRSESGHSPRSDTKVFSVLEPRTSFFDSFSSASPKIEKPKQRENKSHRTKKENKKNTEVRQKQPIGGPRVKHVCRSASVVLGQPIAMFPEKPQSLGEPCDSEVQEETQPVVISDKITPKPQESAPPAVKPINPLPAPSIQVGKKKKNGAAVVSENLVSMDFWEIYDPEEVCETGFSLIGSEQFGVRALCYLCGSAGREKMIHCACCCEPYHEFCIGDNTLKVDGWRWDWVCPRCTICVSCGRASGQQLTCVRCENSYHTECVGGRLPHSSDRPWVCSACLRCKSCNAVDVSIFVGNLPLCKPCFVLRQKGNYCPLCQKCYEDDDYDCKMMECGGCQSWVHAKCEGVSDEKYQVLSFLPESVEFVCRMCCAMPPAPWWLAVEAELKAGYLGVLKALSKNRTACKMLKWSPRKICSCRRRDSAKMTEDDSNGDGDRQSPAPTSDSGMGSTDDEIRTLPEEEDCFCFLEVDSYNSRSKPFSPNLLSIKKKVMDSEYSSLTQFHEDMQSMVETTQSDDLMDVYHVAMKDVFPWFDSRAAKILDASRGGSIENSPIKSSPTKQANPAPCLVPVEKFAGQSLEYFYQDTGVQDSRICLLCKTIGDGPSEDTGRLLYCGQNEWVHCNCALWSGEVFEEIDGSLQNVHSAISRGSRMKCPQCQLKGASVGCCARNCSETFHFSCARAAGCIFLEDKSVYCPAHMNESAGRLLEAEKGFEMRRPVYVELDKRKSKPVESHMIQLAVGSLQVLSIGRFVPELSDLPQTIMPADFVASRVFWSSREPWRLVKYKFSIRLVEPEQAIGVDLGVNLTVDHSKSDVEAKMRTLRYFQVHLSLPPEQTVPTLTPRSKRKRRLPEPLDESENQELLPPEIQEAILKEISHDMLEGISVQDIFQDMSERDEADEDWPGSRSRKTGTTLRTGNRNGKTDKDKGDARWKRKFQEGKENKMVSWCARLLQVDGAVDSSSGSEAGESPGRSVDTPADIPQLDGVEDSDYESCDGLPQTEESPVECEKCKCTYRTQRSYERHLESRCHELLLSSSEDDEESSPPPPPPPAKPRTYTRRRPAEPQAPVTPISTHQPPTVAPIIVPQPAPPPPNTMPVILQEIPYQPVMQYIVEPQKPMLMSNGYQVVLPPSPVVLGSSSPLFEVVTDPHTGGVFLAQPSPQPVLYNMETIVSNTVMQTNQFMTSSFSQTSTQVFQASKQVMNMPTGYMLAPSDLICVPVNTPIATQPTTGLRHHNNSNIRATWTPTKQPKVKAPPRPPPPSKPKSRPGALVDFINNFTIDCSEFSGPESPTIVNTTPPQQVQNQLKQPPPSSPPAMPSPPPPVKVSPPKCDQSTQITTTPAKPPLMPHLANVRTPSGPIPKPPPSPPPPPPAPPRLPIIRPCALPRLGQVPVRRMLSSQTALNISMPSLDDSPPNSCDNSPALRAPQPNQITNSLSLPSLSPVNTFSPPHPISPRLRPLMPSPRNAEHSWPSPSMQCSSSLPLVQSGYINNAPHSTPYPSIQDTSPIAKSMIPNPPPSPVQHSPKSQSPPSPFLIRGQMPGSSPQFCVPSFTPPLPSTRALETTEPSLSENKVPLLSTCDPLPPIGCSVPSIHLDSTRLNKTLSCTPSNPTPTPSGSPSSQSSASPLLLKPPRPPPACAPQPLIETKQQTAALPRLTDSNKKHISELKITPRCIEPEGPKLVYDVISDDGFKFSSTSLAEVYQKICDSVQEVRAAYHMPKLQITPRSFEVLGMSNHGLQHLLEQLPGVGYCKKYQPKYFKQPRNADEDLTPCKENATGCARSEAYVERKECDKFGWLASRHRKVPKITDTAEESLPARKTTNLPMAMRYRALREASKSDMFVYRSKIHGMGLFCSREIEAGEMVMEYSGELIRSFLTDKREKMYMEKGIGCYFFRIDDHTVVDATLKGSSARFINHSCEPNCYSKVVDILGKKHIIIFALRRISAMEELTYDYKFPFEDVKISCHCQSKKCRKYLN